MEIRRIEPSFGNLIRNPRTPAVHTYLHSLSNKKAGMLAQIERDNKNVKIPVYLTMLMSHCKPKFAAEVGDKRFVVNFWQGPITVVRRAAKYAQKLEAERNFMLKVGADKIKPTTLA